SCGGAGSRAMSWRYSRDLDGQATEWSEETFGSQKQAVTEARGRVDGDFWVGWVKPKTYAAQLPPAQQLLGEMQERAAEAGASPSCFDALTLAQIEMLDGLLRKTLENWEAWLPAAGKSDVVIVENANRYKAET